MENALARGLYDIKSNIILGERGKGIVAFGKTNEN